MVESIANIVRALPAERIRDGQPYVALELMCNEGHGGMEWSVNVRCEPRVVVALDAAISATYPDVRVGRRHADAPRPRAGALREPGHVMRFRKQRSFVYPLLAAGEQLASPPVEQIARAQIALGEPSIVRFQLTPTALFFEEYARRRYKQHEQHLARRESAGPILTGLRSTLDRTEMGNAQRTQNRSLFWLETVIAADSLDGVQDARRRRAVAPRGEPPAPPLDDRPPAPVPPPVPASLEAADPLDAVPGVRGRGRAPARTPDRADEGRAGPPADAAADPRPARARTRHR